MKRKGISLWEQHLERIVLGVAILFFVGVIAWQFVANPNTVSEGGRTITPADIDQLVQTRAQDLNVRLQPGAPSPINIPGYQPVLGDFVAQLSAPVSHSDRIMAMQREMRLATYDVTPTELARYHVPVPPAPAILRARQFYDSLQPETVEQYPSLSSYFAPTTYDGTWIVPAAVLDLRAVREAYESSSDDHASVPPNFYDNRLDILTVKVERMRRAGDGSWRDLTSLDVPPGMLTFEPQLQGEVSKGTRDEILGELRRTGAQLEVIRPSFYAMRAGSFLPPSEADAVRDSAPVSEADREIRRIRDRIHDFSRRRAQIERQIRDLGGDTAPAPPAPGPTRPGGSGAAPGTPPGGGLGGPGGGSGRREAPGGGGAAPPGGAGGGGLGDPSGGDRSGGAGGPGAQEDARRATRIAGLRAELERLTERINRERQRVQALTGRAEDIGSDAADAVPVDPMSAERLVIWAHDLDVRPGETYRYRFTVSYYNPFFARRLDLMEDQHTLADAITLPSMASEWSDPVTVELPQRIFIVEANAGTGESGFGEVMAEVFRFYDGRWWRETFRVEPGLQIGNARRIRAAGSRVQDVEVDFATEWFLLDVVPDLDADREAVERGRGARAVLQRITGTGRLVLDPRLMATDPLREWLMWSVEDADREPDLALGQ